MDPLYSHLTQPLPETLIGLIAFISLAYFGYLKVKSNNELKDIKIKKSKNQLEADRIRTNRLGVKLDGDKLSSEHTFETIKKIFWERTVKLFLYTLLALIIVLCITFLLSKYNDHPDTSTSDKKADLNKIATPQPDDVKTNEHHNHHKPNGPNKHDSVVVNADTTKANIKTTTPPQINSQPQVITGPITPPLPPPAWILEDSVKGQGSNGSLFEIGWHIGIRIMKIHDNNEDKPARNAKIEVCYTKTGDNCDDTITGNKIIIINSPLPFYYEDKKYELLFYDLEYPRSAAVAYFRLRYFKKNPLVK